MIEITREQLEAMVNIFKNQEADCHGSFTAALDSIGITIAKPEPPEAMVRLAREIVAREVIRWPAAEPVCEKVALAALQHAEKVVREHTNSMGWANPDDILRKLGADV